MRPIAVLSAALVFLGMSQPLLAKEHEHAAHGPAIPSSLQSEHHELHEALGKATRLGGQTGAAAKALEEALMPHFKREEEFALLPLGLLPELSEGKVRPEMRSALAKTEQLRREMPRMLSEHQAIVSKLEQLERAAEKEKRADVVRFAHQLKAHAVTEEQLLYPTSLLVGEYLRLKLKP